MSTKLATEDAVFRAADAIASSGEKPTVIAIRAITGGSFTTIGKHLTAWNMERASEAAVKLPPEVEQIVLHAGREIWTRLNEMENNRVRVALEAAEQTVKQAEEHRQYAQLDLKSAEVLLESAYAETRTAQMALKESQAKCIGLEAKLLALQAACEELRGRVDDGMKTNAELIKELGVARGGAVRHSDSAQLGPNNRG